MQCFHCENNVEDFLSDFASLINKGLQYFDVADAELFFGREKLTAELVDHLRHHSFLAVIGASGSGKSSLVRAGLVSALQKGEKLDDGSFPPDHSETWPVLLLTPTSRLCWLLSSSSGFDEFLQIFCLPMTLPHLQMRP